MDACMTYKCCIECYHESCLQWNSIRFYFYYPATLEKYQQEIKLIVFCRMSKWQLNKKNVNHINL